MCVSTNFDEFASLSKPMSMHEPMTLTRNHGVMAGRVFFEYPDAMKSAGHLPCHHRKEAFGSFWLNRLLFKPVTLFALFVFSLAVISGLPASAHDSMIRSSERIETTESVSTPAQEQSNVSEVTQIPKKGHPVQLSPSLPIPKETKPVLPLPIREDSRSVDHAATPFDRTKYEPYNTFPRELDLWNLEGRRFIRSPVVVSPDKSAFVYSEVIFAAYNRQTFSRLYFNETEPVPATPLPHLPSEETLAPASTPDYQTYYAKRFEPEQHLKSRQILLEVGYQKVSPFAFRTLTVVDWSADGQRLLIKEKSGVLHVGLRTSDVLIFDQKRGTVTIYPEIRRTIEHYWKTHGDLPHLQEISWELTPLGFEPDSNSAILLKAWAFDTHEKKFLGTWRYDIDAERTELLTLSDQPVDVAANGWLAIAPPASLAQTPLWWKKPFAGSKKH